MFLASEMQRLRCQILSNSLSGGVGCGVCGMYGGVEFIIPKNDSYCSAFEGRISVIPWIFSEVGFIFLC